MTATTNLLLLLLQSIIRSFGDSFEPPTIATILLGSNDGISKTIEGKVAPLVPPNINYQHVPLDLYEANLGKIIDRLLSWSPDCVVIVMTPPPVNEEGWLARCKAMYPDDNKDVTVSNRVNANIEKVRQPSFSLHRATAA
jgi:hypothetical protein